MTAQFRLGKELKIGEVVKNNSKTVWVKFQYEKNIAVAGAEALFKTFTAIIKRHKVKHNVTIQEGI